MKIRNKVLSTLLAATMVVGTAMPAFAANSDAKLDGSDKTEISGSVETPIIKVSIPTTGAVIINPYKMTVDTSVAQDGSGNTTAQIISTPQYIQNNSNVDINVSVSVSGTVAGNAKLATKELTAKDVTNSAFLYAEFLPATAGSDAKDITKVVEPTWATGYDAAKHVLVGAKATTKAIGTLSAAEFETDGTTVKTPTYMGFHLAGSAVSAPTTAWASGDTISVTIAWTFTATATTASAGGSN